MEEGIWETTVPRILAAKTGCGPCGEHEEQAALLHCLNDPRAI